MIVLLKFQNVFNNDSRWPYRRVFQNLLKKNINHCIFCLHDNFKILDAFMNWSQSHKDHISFADHMLGNGLPIKRKKTRIIWKDFPRLIGSKSSASFELSFSGHMSSKVLNEKHLVSFLPSKVSPNKIHIGKATLIHAPTLLWWKTIYSWWCFWLKLPSYILDSDNCYNLFFDHWPSREVA